VTHPAAYGGMRGVSAALNMAGLDRSVAALRPMGEAFAKSRAGRKRFLKAVSHIEWAYPEWGRARVERCALDAFRSLFGLGAEFACGPRVTVIRTDGQFPPRVELGRTRGAIELLLGDRPCIMIGAHVGNWEVLGATIASLGVKVHALYRPLNQRPVDAWVRQTRAARGLMLIDKFGAAERMQEIAAKGESVGFTADQDAGRKGVFVPFFGRLSSAYKSIGLLAMQHEMPLVCGFARRLGGPDASVVRYKAEVQDVILPEDWADQPDPLFYITARHRKAVEDMVRVAPEQYLWMHGAWKTRPAFEIKAKGFPAALREKMLALPWMTEAAVERVVERSDLDAAALAGSGGRKRKKKAE